MVPDTVLLINENEEIKESKINKYTGSSLLFMNMNNACNLVLSFYMKQRVNFCTQGVPNAN